MTTTTRDEVIVSTECNCFDEDGTYALECLGCNEDSRYELEEFLLKKWMELQGDAVSDLVYIEGSNMGWTRLSGWTNARLEDLVEALSINGDYTLYFALENGELTCRRTSHDEPTGASFKISSFVA